MKDNIIMSEEVAGKSFPHANDTYDMIHEGMLDQFKSKRISLVGKVEDYKGSNFTLVCNGDTSL